MPCLSFLDHCRMLSHCIWSKTYKIGLPRWHQWQRTRLSKQEVRDTGSIPGLGRSPEEGYATCSSIHAWRIPWTEESGGLWSWGHKELDKDWSDLAHTPLLTGFACLGTCFLTPPCSDTVARLASLPSLA